MSRSYHVTKRQLKRERVENAVAGCDSSEMTELEEQNLKKRLAKDNESWKSQATRDGLSPALKLRLKDKKLEVS